MYIYTYIHIYLYVYISIVQQTLRNTDYSLSQQATNTRKHIWHNDFTVSFFNTDIHWTVHVWKNVIFSELKHVTSKYKVPALEITGVRLGNVILNRFLLFSCDWIAHAIDIIRHSCGTDDEHNLFFVFFHKLKSQKILKRSQCMKISLLSVFFIHIGEVFHFWSRVSSLFFCHPPSQHKRNLEP